MATPTAIRKQAEAVDKMHAQIYPVQTEARDPEKEQAEIDAKEKAESGAPVSTDDLAVGDEAPKVEEAAPAVEEAAPAAAPVVDAGWEQKYKTLQGKYDAEVPRLNIAVRDLQAQNKTLSEAIASLKQPEPDPKPAASESPKLIKDEEISEYGADLINVMRRAAREEFGGELDQLKTENAQLKDQLGGVSSSAATIAQEQVYTTLDTQVPTWKELNGDAGFLAWLGENDVYAGTSRHILLQQAFAENDAARVVNFFKGYQNEHAALNPQANEAPAAAAERKPAVDMSEIAAPGKPRAGGGVSTQDGKRIWRQADITAFYADVRRGKYKHDPAKKASLEADIIAAGPEGRIVA